MCTDVTTNTYQGRLVGHHKMSQKVTHDHTSKFEVPLEALHNAQCKEILMMSIEYVVLMI